MARRIIELFRSTAEDKNLLIINPGYENLIRLAMHMTYGKRDQMLGRWNKKDIFNKILFAFAKSIGGYDHFEKAYSISELLYLRQAFDRIIRSSNKLSYL